MVSGVRNAADSPVSIMVVDDDPGMLEVLELMLTSRGYRVVAEADGRRAIERVKSEKFDLAVMDIRMRPVDGLAVLKEVKRFSPDTVVIMISAYANAETAVEAMKAGAYDYLPKPFKVEEFMEIIEEALERRRLESSDQEREKHGEGILHFGLLVGESPAMQQVYRLIEKVAQIDSTVLIRGESGTGKELVARAIHRLSARASSPMVVVNCCGVPESLIESELFGYKKGAFTGATRDRCGLVEAANHGTLFLDEVGELSPQLQAKLLRLLQEKTIRPVGGTVDVPVDVRIIAATNRDLEKMVLEGTFREDLYYRLNVIPIHLPPLRERREDIPLLAQYFLQKYAKQLGKDVRRISAYALDILRSYDFPGNVRELENIIERGVALEQSTIILPENLTIAGALAKRRSKKKLAAENIGGISLPELSQEGLDLDDLLEEVERYYLKEALKLTGGVKQRAAELLKMSFRSFRYRLAKYGIE